MATFTKDDRIRILKLKGAENYRSWAIYVHAALESRAVWGIVLGTQIAHAAPEFNSEKLIKDAYLEYSQKQASAKGILILSIDLSILTDKCTTSTAKAIWDYYYTQYKEKEFVLRFTLFIHLITSKVSLFRSITDYNADFQITLDKLRSWGDSIPDDLKLAEYLHGIEDTYPDFAAAHRSAARTKVPAVSSVMAELEDKGRKSSDATALSIRIKETKRGGGRGRGSNSGRGRGTGSGGRPRTQEVCSHCDHQGHSEPNCWKKYPEKAPNSHKRDDATQKRESSKSSGKGKRDGVVFNLATIANSADSSSDSGSQAYITQLGFQWNVDSCASDHMTRDRDVYETHTYREFQTPKNVQGAGGNLMAVGIGEVRLTVKSPDGRSREAVLHNVLHCPSLFTNLVSASCLRKKGWYLHGGTETINRISDNFQLASAPIQNGLYVLQTLHKTPFATVARKDTSLKTWHRRLGHPSWANLKRFGNARGMDISKLREVDKHLLVCKICVQAKQKRKPSYKAQSQPEDICKILHVDLMGPISPTRWNGCRYALTFADGYSRC